jgi:hypothetical protein
MGIDDLITAMAEDGEERGSEDGQERGSRSSPARRSSCHTSSIPHQPNAAAVLTGHQPDAAEVLSGQNGPRTMPFTC